MTCLSELTCSVYVDGELSPEETRAAEAHLATCARCRSLVAALRGEIGVVSAALAETAELAPSPAHARAVVAAPVAERVATNGRRTWGLAAIVAALAGTGILAVLAGTATVGDWTGAAVGAAVFVVLNAETLWGALATLALATMAALTLAGAVYLGRPVSRGLAGVALAFGVAAAIAPSSAEALEARRGVEVSVDAVETVDGTLTAAAEHVRVDGNVRGDLIVAAARVEVRGTVGGDLVVAARTVEVTGTVEGSVYVAAGSLTLRGRVGRGLYAADRVTRIEPGAQIGGDLAVAGRSLFLGGEVARGASMLVRDAEVSGHVRRDVRFRGHRLAVRAPARLEGIVRADVARASDVSVDDGAAVTGPVLTRVGSRAGGWLGEPRVWFWVATSFFGPALLGWVALLIVPGVVAGSAEDVRRWGRSLGWGVAFLVGGPVAILLLAVTLVGLPLALVALGLYLLGLYAAKIVVGLAIGRALLKPRGHPRRDALRALVVGLVLVSVASALPFVGGAIWVAIACLGAGALAVRIARAARGVRSSEA